MDCKEMISDDIKPIFDPREVIMPGYDSVGDDMLGGGVVIVVRAPGWDS